MTYAQDRADFEALYEIAELADCVEIDAGVFDLMRNPTKAEAARLYRSAIDLWFTEHKAYYRSHPVAAAIVERRGIGLDH